MPSYFYTARDSKGGIVHGKQEAESEYLAIRVLQSRNLVITDITDANTQFKASQKKKNKKRHKRVKAEDLLFFIRQTSVLLDAGIPLLRSVGVIEAQIESERLYTAILVIKDDMRAGLTFKDALAKHPKVFPGLWAFLIEAGESSGNLPLILHQLADHLEASMNLKKKMTSALIYPTILVSLSLAAVLVFMLKIIPVFAKLFANFNAKLPPLTMAVIATSNFFQRYFVLMVVLTFAGIYLARRYIATPAGRRNADSLLINLPMFGPLIRDSILARISINLSTMVKSGVNLLKSIEICSKVAGNTLYESALENVGQDIQQGRTLSGSLAENELFAPMMVHMIAIGEESGKLPEMLERVAKYYAERVDVFLERLNTLIEPVVLVLVGGLVGILVVSMFLPIFTLSNVIK